LEGTLPTETQYFHQLETLVVQFNNKLTGTLPQGLSILQYLQDLQLQYCSILGSVPNWIGDIHTLVSLGLGNNRMTGIIPTEIGLLTKLQVLGLDDNSFEGNLNLFSPMTSLKSLYLEDNSFTGSLSETMYQDWPALEELDLSANAFITELPESIFTSETLVVLDLHKNFFKGTIPEIGVQTNNTVLNFVALYDNLLMGTIPESIDKIPNLMHLDVAINNLNLPFPTELGELTKLRYLFTGQNDFADHAFPLFLEKLTNLGELSMKNNQLTGVIPTWISALSKIQLLDLGLNQLTGEIPSELGLILGLDHLLLNRNQLEGSLPDSFDGLFDLGTLLLIADCGEVKSGPRRFFILLLILLFFSSYSSDLVLLDHNNLTGDTNILCDAPVFNIQYLVSDCKADPATSIAEIDCKCCDLCCNDANATCNNLAWNVNLVSYCGEVWYLLVRPRCFFIVLLILILLLFSSRIPSGSMGSIDPCTCSVKTSFHRHKSNVCVCICVYPAVSKFCGLLVKTAIGESRSCIVFYLLYTGISE
jgi:Leucine-rich repeat (LRR) protein